jgi:hypothetical protein
MRILTLAALLSLGSTAVVQAQGFRVFNERNHPYLDWQVAETSNFRIVFPAHLAGIEVEAAAIAEESYEVLSAQLGVTFDRPIRIYLSDEDEIANGFAVAIGPGHTNIWVHVNETAEIWTGEEKWLRKVIAHELAHIFHYRAVRSPLGLAQELVANPMPRFWTEGLAQYLTEDWDAQRGDRWLRTAVFEGRLSYEDGTSPWAGRLLYASGNSQVRYLAQTYGDTTITNILEHRRRFLPGIPVHDFYSAFQAVLGKPYREFYDEWRKHVGVYYNTLAGQMERVDSLGAPLRIPGHFVYDAAYSPDTSLVAALVLTSVERPVRRLAVIRGLTDTLQQRHVSVIAEGNVSGPVAWRADGAAVAYTRRLRGDHGSLINDIFVHDLEASRTTRLTYSRRASYPTFAPDGRIAYIVNEGPMANIFILEPTSGVERRLTALTGDVQLVGLRWSPDGSRLVTHRFEGDGSRHLVLVDAETGAIEALGVSDPTTDDRLPVWSPDGNQLAFTSLRDDVPNVFVVDVPPVGGGQLAATGHKTQDAGHGTQAGAQAGGQVGDAGPGREALSVRRATHVFTGATVTDWLPADEVHPQGRLVVVSSESQRRERAYLIDATREVIVEAPPAAPLPYTLWTTHRPDHELPAQIDPRPDLITARSGYNSWRNITHAMTLVLPYSELDGSEYGITGATAWFEPLGKHEILAFGSVSLRRPREETFAALIYRNNQLKPSLTFSLYRYPDPARWYGTSILVEDLAGIDVSASLPLDLFTLPFFGMRLDARARYAHATPFDPEAFVDIETTTPLLPPEAGYRAELRFGLTAKHQRPYRFNNIYPLDGTGLRVRTTIGLPVLGAETNFVRPDVQSYWVSPEMGIGRFYLYGRAQAQFGRTLAQDVIGLSRYDDIDLQLPMLEPVTLSDTERVRGYRSYAIGDRMLFGTIEYRLPPVINLQTRILGFLNLGRVSPAMFVDLGMVWSGADVSEAIRRTGVGLELKNRVSLGAFSFTHAVGAAQRWADLGERFDWDHIDLYYRIQAVLPF